MAAREIHIDSTLLARIAEGEEIAFRELYDQFNKQVFTQAYNYLQSSELASDAVQEVFIKIWSARLRLPEVKDIKSFIFIVTRNVIVSDLRKKVFHHHLNEETELLQADTVLPDRQLSLKESMAIVLEAIHHLTPQQRKVYTLSRTVGLSHDEIAKQMGISTETVRTHIKQALRSLRKYLSDRSVDLAMLILFIISSRWPH